MFALNKYFGNIQWSLFLLILTHLLDVPDVPDIDRVVVVDDRDLEVLLVIGDRGRVGVSRLRRMGRHVRYRQAFGHVHAGETKNNELNLILLQKFST